MASVVYSDQAVLQVKIKRITDSLQKLCRSEWLHDDANTNVGNSSTLGNSEGDTQKTSHATEMVAWCQIEA